MTVSRKQFLQSMAGGTVVLLFQGCGGGGSSYSGSGSTPMPSTGGCSASAITLNHGHALTIARADLDSTTDKTYSIAGSAGHDHTVTFTPAMLATLKGGTMVTVTASTNQGHNHDVTVTCT